MIESLFLVFCMIILGGFILIIVVTMTIADVQNATLEKAFRRHPHARNWRSRPYISVIYTHPATKTSRLSLTKGSYRHIDFKDSHHDLRLHIGAEDVLNKNALTDANRIFQHRPSVRSVEIIPMPNMPQTIRAFFHTYYTIAIAPFIKVRAVVRITPTVPVWPVLSSAESTVSWRDYFSAIFSWIVGTTNMLLLLYLTTVMITTGESFYLLFYVALFYFWLAWSIIDHPHLRLFQKITYIVLGPASFGYFLYRALAAPFMPLKRLPFRFIQRRVQATSLRRSLNWHTK